MNAVWRDLRCGFRMLLKTPVFTTAAVVSLSLGIGANLCHTLTMLITRRCVRYSAGFWPIFANPSAWAWRGAVNGKPSTVVGVAPARSPDRKSNRLVGDLYRRRGSFYAVPGEAAPG